MKRENVATFRTKPYGKTAFGITLGVTVTYLSLIVIIPLGALFLKSTGIGWEGFWKLLTHERILAALYLSFGAGATAAILNLFIGFLFAWVLVRYNFPGKSLLDSLVDLPFTLPTAVAGIALTTIYTPNGIIGKFFEPFGIKIAYTPIGIVIALVFIGFPFVVRTVQPVLEEFPKELEESAYCLGANRWQIFRRVIFPELISPLVTGAAMAFARGIGEYGSVVFISGNLPGKTEILPLLIVTKLEQYEYEEATGIAFIMLVISFSILLCINVIQNIAVRKSE
ncbi:sulfate ABC transporter permease subunit CysT [Leptospira interrogans]|uniref:Sulfate transport system permease protein CysT n=1 Tax=Leptospira interrogans serovar Pyrogenes str. L0374 TaxID=1049928 RepID=M6K536_LEPIR|nr:MULTISPECIES: sulfate ABC transporter permease subunit CysT [Leptospira]EMN29221.1 sulfate ABC transporter, permease protein CysT [Leptospira interrogans serovar Pyrogenes str. L0374]EKO05534.1 sulfate ABC transporter, permease protein CysT [Leptospira interrogans str. C10069]ULG82635.1 sulfate ABC transporter permease subunit CysT [Leptospira interrogans]ULG87124.1 sulfate ABC transporter permease subunit CysT [Leptospira interrogans]UML77249.1 sulfate ABC transporter permease subunit CysT